MLYVPESRAAATDADLALLAEREDRIVVTQDYDFGEMAVREHTVTTGVMMIACNTLPIIERAARVAEVARSNAAELQGALIVVERRRIRRRVLR